MVLMSDGGCPQEIRPSQMGAVMKEIKSEKCQKVTEGAVLHGAIREDLPETFEQKPE